MRIVVPMHETDARDGSVENAVAVVAKINKYHLPNC